jgi:hypothetical protein
MFDDPAAKEEFLRPRKRLAVRAAQIHAEVEDLEVTRSLLLDKGHDEEMVAIVLESWAPQILGMSDAFRECGDDVDRWAELVGDMVQARKLEAQEG